MLLSRTLQPAFSSEIKVTSRSPPANIPKDSEPFFQPTRRTGTDFSTEMHQSAISQSDSQSTTTEHTGKGFSASQHQPTSQLTSDRQKPSSSTSKRTGKGSSATLHEPASQLVTDRPQDLLIGALVQTPMLSGNSPPASLIWTGTDLQHLISQVPTLLPIDTNLLASITLNLMLTDQLQLLLPTPVPLHFVSRERTVFLVSVPAQTDFSDRPPVDLYAEEGELSDDTDATTMEPHQMPSEEQT